MTRNEKIPLIVISLAVIVLIAWTSDFFEVITEHPLIVMGLVALLAFIVRKSAYAILSGTAGEMSPADDEAMEKSRKKNASFESSVWSVLGWLCLGGGLFFGVTGKIENGVTLFILGLAILFIHWKFIKEK